MHWHTWKHQYKSDYSRTWLAAVAQLKPVRIALVVKPEQFVSAVVLVVSVPGLPVLEAVLGSKSVASAPALLAPAAEPAVLEWPAPALAEPEAALPVLEAALAEPAPALAEPEAALPVLEAALAEPEAALAEPEAALAEPETALAEPETALSVPVAAPELPHSYIRRKDRSVPLYHIRVRNGNKIYS
ncbi:MAG: hypothetical protein KH381_06350 [Clostridium sp.]|nr:hypothetical protein [Clostridium sp.]